MYSTNSLRSQNELFMRYFKIGYWISTGIVLLVMAASGWMQMVQTNPHLAKEMQFLGFPLYFIRLVGIAKLLGVLGFFAPNFSKMKEWIYAGFAYVLIFAMQAHAVHHIFPVIHLLLLLLLTLSYGLRQAILKGNGNPRIVKWMTELILLKKLKHK